MIKKSDFKPAWWLKNSHLQTLYPVLVRKNHPLYPIKRERLETLDNDFIDIDWCGDKSHPIVILLHGLTGSSKSTYIIGVQNILVKNHFRTATLNFRGCSGQPNRLARGYHSGDIEDIHFLYQTLCQRTPGIDITAIGFSLGGNVLLKWLGEYSDKVSIKAAVAVSTPLILSECANKLDTGFAKIYRNKLLKELLQYINIKKAHLKETQQREADKIEKLGDLSGISSFWDYDERVVAKLHGFKSAEHYYQVSSSRQYLAKITTPTLMIQSKDDPFMTEMVLPGENELSPTVTLEITEYGGHLGFISGVTPFNTEYWLEIRILDFLKSHCNTCTES